ncbi:hypothetical protein PC121_g8429 [Phytophthora cactorum]|nr:hypothetical protein PC120_g7452 [Phytophthora cactorum]KAG3074184.1 hypothetical protein PC121_g8429 [Phytophthora cactorum]KAG4057268.1 hypothetical protein PC123_g7700 [Phytophthora cactorum]
MQLFQPIAYARLIRSGEAVCREDFLAATGVCSDADRAAEKKAAQQAFRRISGELFQFSDDVFDSAMSQFDEWWHNLRQGQTVIPPPHSSGSSGHHDNSEGGEGADGGALEVVAPLIAVAVDSHGIGENVQNTTVISSKQQELGGNHFLPEWEIKQKLEPASGLLTGVGVVFN